MVQYSLNRHPSELIRILLRFFGSMNLAIILLVTIAIASIIGTILRQNEPYQNYIVKFGPFWHEIYKGLGLYDVYSSAWFIFILAFLVISTGLCVTRNAAKVIQSMRRFKLDIQKNALLNMKDNAIWVTKLPAQELQQALQHYLKSLGYRTKVRSSGGQYTIAAMKGVSNRLGYLLTHIAIVIICIGGLLDGNLPLKIRALTGAINIETRDIPAQEFPAASKLAVNNPSFRASVSIPEGNTVDFAYVRIANGFVLQPLPFAIEVKDFRIEQYDSGQPKSFESDLVIHAPGSEQLVEQTISVNHPLSYKGYTLYQASFGDGGSSLRLQAHILQDPKQTSFDMEGIVNQHLNLKTPQGPIRLEVNEFRRFNIFPITNDVTNRKFNDHGPNFTFKIRQADGTAKEYVNYMYPITIEQREYFLSGIRSSPNEEFRYLHIPVDPEYSPKRFLKFHSRLYDDKKVNAIIAKAVQDSNIDQQLNEENFNDEIANAINKLLELFRNGGFDVIANYIDEHIPSEQHETAANTYMNMLQNTLREIYLTVLLEEGITEDEISEEDIVFFDDATRALAGMHLYDSPFYLQLDDFTHKQATGLQVTRTPGKKFVYLGFTLLIIGVFLLFYISHQRLWCLLRKEGELTYVTLAGIRTRHRHEFSKEFDTIVEQVTTGIRDKE